MLAIYYIYATAATPLLYSIAIYLELQMLWVYVYAQHNHHHNHIGLSWNGAASGAKLKVAKAHGDR